MNFTVLNLTQTEEALTSLWPNIRSECFGDYMAMVFAFLFVISECLPFIKAKCTDDQDVETKTNDHPPSRPGIIHESNSLLELAAKLVQQRRKN